MAYGVRSHDYLQRARQRLDEGTPEGTLYAALELRCGIEARIQLYLAAQTESDKLRKGGWKVAVLGKELERRFKLGEKTIHIQVLGKDDNTVIDNWFYTPVTRKLRTLHGKLGNYLHALNRFRSINDPWWQQARKFMEDVYVELEKATRGNLMSVPLMNPENREVQFTLTPADDDESRARLSSIAAHQQYVLRVSYVDEAPLLELAM